MASELDETLKDILNNADWFQDGLNPSGEEDRDEAVDNIKQAFINAGWDNYRSHAHFGEPLMTGEEWYDRFAKNLDDVEAKLVIHNKTATKDEVLQAARKAAGIV